MRTTDSNSNPRFAKTDKRLLGTWKSDRVRTFKEWRFTKRLSQKRKTWFKSLFGKLEITYSRTCARSVLPHRKWEQSQRYAIVATDETSVAIVLFGKILVKNQRHFEPVNLQLLDEFLDPRPQIQHLHFDNNHYWISLGNGRNREFFRKLRHRK